jgi:hydroxypyruvate isomerase
VVGRTVIGFSIHVSMLFRELPYLERPAAAYEAGFNAIETWWPGELVEPWAAEVERVGIGVALVNSFGGDIEAGERGFLNIPERRERTLKELEAAVQVAVAVGAPRVNVLAGRALPDVPLRRQRAQAAATLREGASVAASAGITVLVEPINEGDIPGYLVPTVRDVRDLLEDVASDSVRLLYDAYHAARAGSDPVEEVVDHVDVVDHVHYADCPGRGAPGTGAIDLDRLIEALDGAGWSGVVGLEYEPAGDTAATLARFRERRTPSSKPLTMHVD